MNTVFNTVVAVGGHIVCRIVPDSASPAEEVTEGGLILPTIGDDKALVKPRPMIGRIESIGRLVNPELDLKADMIVAFPPFCGHTLTQKGDPRGDLIMLKAEEVLAVVAVTSEEQ